MMPARPATDRDPPRDRAMKVHLVAQGAWHSSKLSMPLALACLKTYALDHPELAGDVEIEIFNYDRGASVSRMAREVFADPPDVVGFSVLGWNYRNFGLLTETYRQLRPDGWCIFGGNHVTHQAARTFRNFPEVDVVVNGEGEVTFRELLLARKAGKALHELASIAGLSINVEGSRIDTPARPRLKDLDVIPSPLLTGAIPLFDERGEFLYDVALMETNRGCPYACSFCYWGGAIGQKMYSFSRERLSAELAYLAQNGVENICLCDSNFGMLPADEEFVDDLIALRREYGYPRDLITSWAKNKKQRFFSIMSKLKDSGFRADFTLSLQTLEPTALELMKRKNMQLNQFEDLCEQLQSQGMAVHAELIWGAPGETVESFLAGYDRVAAHISRIATYPLLLLPNTDYDKRRAEYDFLTVRDQASDYEFVLSHTTMSIADNEYMHRFLFWSRVVAEYQILRYIWTPLRVLAGVEQSEIILSMARWFGEHGGSAAAGLLRFAEDVVENLDVTRIPDAVTHIYLEAEALGPLFRAWWRDEMMPRVEPDQRAFFDDLFEYDWMSRPVHDQATEARSMPTAEVDGIAYYTRDVEVGHDIPHLVHAMQFEGSTDIEPTLDGPTTLHHQVGFYAVCQSHEFVPRYAAKNRAQLDALAARVAAGQTTRVAQPYTGGMLRPRTSS